MQIAVLSDSHDNVFKLEAALAEMKTVDSVIHCGDLCSPFVIERIGSATLGKSVHIVWGNNEGDIRLICQNALRYPNILLHGALARLEIDGLKVGVNHYPEIARDLAASGSYDLVCFGHDHTAFEGKVGDCTLLNPGEILGMNGSSTFAIFDTKEQGIRWIEV